MEIFLLDKQFGKLKKNELHLWYCQRDVTNKYYFNQIKSKLIILPGYILYPIQALFFKFKFTHKFIFYKIEKRFKNLRIIDNNYIDKNNLLIQTNPILKFPKDEIERGTKFLSKNQIYENDKIVCISSRTSKFRNENYESTRNASINSQLDAVKFLLSKGYKIVKLGRDKNIKLNINDKKIFDYSSLNLEDDFLEFFIMSKSSFMICTDSGINALPVILRKPRLIVNFVNFKNLYLNDNKFTPFILPKKIFSKKKKEFLSYKDILEKKIMDVDTIDLIPDEYELIDNSKQEILDASIDMYNFLNSKEKKNNLERHNQDFFFKQIEKSYGKSIENLAISPSFFNSNRYLFDK